MAPSQTGMQEFIEAMDERLGTTNAQNHRVAAGEYRLKNSRTATPVHFFVMRR
jgi:hypothetical protein